MRPFWKCLTVIKTLVRTKLKFYPFWKNWGLIYIFGSFGPKSKNPHKFSSLNFIMLNETILEMPYYQLNFGKNLKFYLFGGALELISLFGPTGPKQKRPLIKIIWSSWSVKYLVDFLLPKRNRLWQKTLCFLNISFL